MLPTGTGEEQTQKRRINTFRWQGKPVVWANLEHSRRTQCSGLCDHNTFGWQFSLWQQMNYTLDCDLICQQASSPPHSCTVWAWLRDGWSRVIKQRWLHTHTHESRILERDDRDSALNVCCSISGALCRCVRFMLPFCSPVTLVVSSSVSHSS